MIWPFGMLRIGAYGVILADPPWAFQGYVSQSVPQRAADQHYQTMTFEELADLPVARLAQPDCALFMWSISSHTPQALALGEAWGFKFASKAFTWAKTTKHARAKQLDDPAMLSSLNAHGIQVHFTCGHSIEDCTCLKDVFTQAQDHRRMRPTVIKAVTLEVTGDV